jgi:ankyrin repeat protein
MFCFISNCLFNEVNNSCRNPLHEAAECGAIDVAKLLVKAGTNPLVRETCYNATPYILAHKAQKMDASCACKQLFVVSVQKLPKSNVSLVFTDV